jgi:hypothetical protein
LTLEDIFAFKKHSLLDKYKDKKEENNFILSDDIRISKDIKITQRVKDILVFGKSDIMQKRFFIRELLGNELPELLMCEACAS